MENSLLKCVQAFWLHSIFIYTVNLKRGLYSQVCKLNCRSTVLYIIPATVSYRYAAVNIRLSTQQLTTYAFDISRQAYFTIIPDSILKIPKRCVLVSRRCEIVHRGKHDRLIEGWHTIRGNLQLRTFKVHRKDALSLRKFWHRQNITQALYTDIHWRTRHISAATILRTSSGRNIARSITRVLFTWVTMKHNTMMRM